MRHILIPFALCLAIIACSSKEPLPGEREELIVAEIRENVINELDISPIILDQEKENSEYTQAFLDVSHCSPPLKFSSSPLEIWSSKVDFEASKSILITAAPVVAEGKVFCIDAAGIVYAFDQNTGERLWRVSTTIVGKDGGIGGAIAYDAGRVIITSSFSECFSLNAKDGKILWRIKLIAPSKGDGITVSNGKAFITCNKSSLQVIDINNGKVLWSHSGMVADSTYIGDSCVAIDNGVVYLVYPSGEIYALLEETGAMIWDAMMSKFSLTNVAHAFSHLRACPVVKNDILYVVAANGQTAAFDAKTGKLRWKSDVGGVQTPIVSGNCIFVFNSNSEVVCLNRETGKKRWSEKLTLDKDRFSDWYGMLLLKDYLLMVSPHGEMIYVSAYDGKIEKTMELGDSDGVSVNPVIANGTMYILLNSGKIIAYR